jgi:hypothetical protein
MSHEEALGIAQILLTLLVFALGIPALVIEATAEERIRYLLHKRAPHLPMMLLMVLALAAVGGLVWFSGLTDSPVTHFKTVGVQPEPFRSNDLAAERVYGSRRIVSVIPTQTWLSRYAGRLEQWAKILTLALLAIFGSFWLVMMKLDVRTLLVWTIAEQMRWRFRIRGSFRDADLEDLIVLGENSPSGYEKNYVISRVRSVSSDVIAHERYTGTELTPLIAGMARIVASSYRPGTDVNFFKAAEVIEEIWMAVQRRQMFENKKDGATMKETAAALGVAAVEFGRDTAALACINAIPNQERVFYRVGVAALRATRFRVALAALSKLEAIADRKQLLSKELIALSAYFSVAGVHASSVGRAFQSRLARTYSRNEVHAAALRAADDFALIGEYEAADTVIAAYADGASPSASASSAPRGLIGWLCSFLDRYSKRQCM